jgi:hypothetical protein
MANPDSSLLVGTDAELEALNDTLILLSLPPVNGLVFQGGEDAHIVYTRMLQTYKTEASRGWYLFNRSDGFKLTADTNGFVLFNTLVTRVMRDNRAHDMPQFRLTQPQPAALLQVSALTPIDDTPFNAGQKFTVDVVWNFAIGAASPEFLNFVVHKTAQSLAHMYNPQLDPHLLEQAHDLLRHAEAEATPRSNVMNDEVDTFSTWFRR